VPDDRQRERSHAFERTQYLEARSYQQVVSPWRLSVFKLGAARTIGTTRSELAEAQTAGALLARAMCASTFVPVSAGSGRSRSRGRRTQSRTRSPVTLR
jgi:hypothetical protein